MNLLRLENIKTKDKKQLLNQICIMHKRMLSSKAITEKFELLLQDSNSVDEKLFNRRSISIFDTILELLPKEEKEIIVKDFIDKQDFFWYLEKYSKTKYYQLKNSAMNNFLYLFYK